MPIVESLIGPIASLIDKLIPDKVHPNTEGATAIANAVHLGLTGKKSSN